MKGSRKSEDQKAGVGKQTIIDGTGKWKKLIGASCIYGIKYVKRFYLLHKIVSFQVNKITMKYFLITLFIYIFM